MKSKNVGSLDRFVRLLIALGFGYLGYSNNMFWYIFGAYFLLTVLSGRCIIYSMANVNTLPAGYDPKSKKKQKDMRYRPNA